MRKLHYLCHVKPFDLTMLEGLSLNHDDYKVHELCGEKLEDGQLATRNVQGLRQQFDFLR